jgi:FAD/FMN-containing dehydrogenase
MPGGNVGPGVSVDLRGLGGVTVDPESGTARLGPGLIADELDAAAAPHGLFFPAAPSSSDRCTLGGMVANNAAGARSFGYGTVRDRVEAVELVLADGSRTTVERGAPLPPVLAELRGSLRSRSRRAVEEGWPRVRKNSSGYGLDRFLPDGDGVALACGSEGTLAVVTGARVRLAPRPSERVVLLLSADSVQELAPLADAAEDAGAAACEFLGRRFLEIAGLARHPEVGELAARSEALVLVELDGSRRPLEEGLEIVRRAARNAGSASVEARTPQARSELWRVRHAASPVIAAKADEGLVSMQFIEDSVVPRARLGAYLGGLEEILAEEETDAVMFGHAGDGNVHVNPLVDVRREGWRERVRRILDATARLVASLGGTLAGEHGDGRIRAPYLDVIWGPLLGAAFREVKETLDPRGVLNPGVVVPLPGQDPLDGLSPEPRRR